MQENVKPLLRYIVDSFWDQLASFEHLSSIHSLKVKYEQVILFMYFLLLRLFSSKTVLLAVHGESRNQEQH